MFSSSSLWHSIYQVLLSLIVRHWHLLYTEMVSSFFHSSVSIWNFITDWCCVGMSYMLLDCSQQCLWSTETAVCTDSIFIFLSAALWNGVFLIHSNIQYEHELVCDALSRLVADIITVTITTHFSFSVSWQIHDKIITYHLQTVLLSLKIRMLWAAYANLTKVPSRSHLQQFAPTIIHLALPSNCMHKIPYFLCAPALHEICCTMEIMLSSFDKCAGVSDCLPLTNVQGSQNGFVNLHSSLKLQNSPKI